MSTEALKMELAQLRKERAAFQAQSELFEKFISMARSPDEPEVIKAFDWSSDGKHVFFTKAEESGTSLWQISSEGGEPRMLWQTDIKMRDLQVHPDGHQIAFHSYRKANEVWVMENFLPERNDER